MNDQSWKKFTLNQKLGNIGSEVARARIWDEKNDIPIRNKSLERVLEMLNILLQENLSLSAKKELTKTRELVECWQRDDKTFIYAPRLLEDYFTNFACLAV
jgi:hypothetical protein